MAISKTVQKYLARMAKKGGEVKGPCKRRGDSEYYTEMARKSAAARRAKNE